MITASVQRLQFVCTHIPTLLSTQDKQAFFLKPGLDKWSIKENLEHLIDTAGNNHHSIVRAQFKEHPRSDFNLTKVLFGPAGAKQLL